MQDKVQSLQQQLAGTQAELGRLQQQYSLGEKRLMRASKLISALGDEAGRWSQAAESLLTRLNLLLGQCLLRKRSLTRGSVAMSHMLAAPLSLSVMPCKRFSSLRDLWLLVLAFTCTPATLQC